MDLVASIMTHPRIWPHVSDDFYPAPQDFKPVQNDSIIRLIAREGAAIIDMIIVYPVNALMWICDHCFLPVAWGRKALKAARLAEEWLWLNTPALKVLGLTPLCNTLALKFARKMGFTEVGRVGKCYQRGFELFDIVIFEKARPA